MVELPPKSGASRLILQSQKQFWHCLTLVCCLLLGLRQGCVSRTTYATYFPTTAVVGFFSCVWVCWFFLFFFFKIHKSNTYGCEALSNALSSFAPISGSCCPFQHLRLWLEEVTAPVPRLWLHKMTVPAKQLATIKGDKSGLFLLQLLVTALWLLVSTKRALEAHLTS